MEEDEEASKEGGDNGHLQEFLLDQLKERESAAGRTLSRRRWLALESVYRITL